MKLFVKPSSIIALIVLTIGCESTPPPAVPLNLKIPNVRSDVGLVLVMRYGLGLRMTTGSVPIYVDDKKVFSVKDWGYTYFWVTPGAHKIKAEWSTLEKPMFEGDHFDASTLDLDVEAGKTYFINYQIVKVATRESPMGVLFKPLSKSHVISAGLILETQGTARSKLIDCTFQENHWELAN
jgi:hypothetical protein